MLSRSFRWWTTALGLILVGVFGAAACGGKAENPGDRAAKETTVPWTRVGSRELAQMLGKKDFTLVNVHVPYAGEIRSTDAFIPYDRIAERLGELPAKASKVVLYCQSGRMSTIAAQQLSEGGYTNLYELDGGFDAWKAAGHQLVIDPSRNVKG